MCYYLIRYVFCCIICASCVAAADPLPIRKIKVIQNGAPYYSLLVPDNKTIEVQNILSMEPLSVRFLLSQSIVFAGGFLGGRLLYNCDKVSSMMSPFALIPVLLHAGALILCSNREIYQSITRAIAVDAAYVYNRAHANKLSPTEREAVSIYLDTRFLEYYKSIDQQRLCAALAYRNQLHAEDHSCSIKIPRCWWSRCDQNGIKNWFGTVIIPYEHDAGDDTVNMDAMPSLTAVIHELGDDPQQEQIQHRIKAGGRNSVISRLTGAYGLNDMRRLFGDQSIPRLRLNIKKIVHDSSVLFMVKNFNGKTHCVITNDVSGGEGRCLIECLRNGDHVEQDAASPLYFFMDDPDHRFFDLSYFPILWLPYDTLAEALGPLLPYPCPEQYIKHPEYVLLHAAIRLLAAHNRYPIYYKGYPAHCVHLSEKLVKQVIIDDSSHCAYLGNLQFKCFTVDWSQIQEKYSTIYAAFNVARLRSSRAIAHPVYSRFACYDPADEGFCAGFMAGNCYMQDGSVKRGLRYSQQGTLGAALRCGYVQVSPFNNESLAHVTWKQDQLRSKYYCKSKPSLLPNHCGHMMFVLDLLNKKYDMQKNCQCEYCNCDFRSLPAYMEKDLLILRDVGNIIMGYFMDEEEISDV